MRDIIDFHSHVLPGIDDGSKDVTMSMDMLKASAEQGVTIMAATPHFYADRNTPERFFSKRDEALSLLKKEDLSGLPRIICGAEVAHFRGMGHSDDIESFCLTDTNLLLVEMPFRQWGKGDIREIEYLMERGIQPVIAHIERFFGFQKDKVHIDKLLEYPVYVQVNAEALLNWRQKHMVLKLFKTGRANLLGSDCHNTTTRQQNLGKGREVLRKKLGQVFLDDMDTFGMDILQNESSQLTF